MLDLSILYFVFSGFGDENSAKPTLFGLIVAVCI